MSDSKPLVGKDSKAEIYFEKVLFASRLIL